MFYLVFPFFCVLIENKRRAWTAFAVSLIYNFACANYFEVGRSNILYSACFFLAGGLVYLYREEIMKLNQWVALVIAGGAVVLYYLVDGNAMMCLLVSTTLLVYAIIKRGGETAEQSYKVLQWSQYGNLPVSHGNFSCC